MSDEKKDEGIDFAEGAYLAEPCDRAGQKADLEVKSSELTLTIIRADGRREELGVVSYNHRNPILRWIGRSKIFLRQWWRQRQTVKQ